MPVTISPLPPGDIVGPGLGMQVTTDIIGPIGVDWYYRILWYDAIGGETVIASNRIVTQGFRSISFNLGWNFSTDLDSDLQHVANGTTVRAVLELRNAAGVLQDDGELTDQTWQDTNSAMGVDLLRRTVQTNGFSSTNAATLNAIQAAVTSTIHLPGIGDLIQGIGNFFRNPGLGQLTEYTTDVLISGTGSIYPSDVVTPTGFAWGMILDLTAVPDAFGLQLGVRNRWFERLAQLETIHELHSGRFVSSEVLELNTDTYLWIFREPIPTLVNYYVTVGCEYRVHWLA